MIKNLLFGKLLTLEWKWSVCLLDCLLDFEPEPVGKSHICPSVLCFTASVLLHYLQICNTSVSTSVTHTDAHRLVHGSRLMPFKQARNCSTFWKILSC